MQNYLSELYVVNVSGLLYEFFSTTWQGWTIFYQRVVSVFEIFIIWHKFHQRILRSLELFFFLIRATIWVIWILLCYIWLFIKMEISNLFTFLLFFDFLVIFDLRIVTIIVSKYYAFRVEDDFLVFLFLYFIWYFWWHRLALR